jgi:hypothetical protein
VTVSVARRPTAALDRVQRRPSAPSDPFWRAFAAERAAALAARTAYCVRRRTEYRFHDPLNDLGVHRALERLSAMQAAAEDRHDAAADFLAALWNYASREMPPFLLVNDVARMIEIATPSGHHLIACSANDVAYHRLFAEAAAAGVGQPMDRA